ncbi:hypothetical protein MRB53_009154 [Persea americana]|uniref:Uncharacterized protein n=1 Tax=Persea americana TaxID=3435 RepID=A0ACC2LN75_PERAE|nr:hypothetical protein MRB53_009154 [Persea americana]
MMQKGVFPNEITYNALINGLCKLRRLEEAYNLFYEMQSKGLSPNKYTYTLLINENRNLGNWNEALRLYCQMLEKDIQPDACTHHVLLSSLMRTAMFMQLSISRMKILVVDCFLTVLWRIFKMADWLPLII